MNSLLLQIFTLLSLQTFLLASPIIPSTFPETRLTFYSQIVSTNGIVKDGEGGSANIPNIDIEIRNISDINGSNTNSIT